MSHHLSAARLPYPGNDARPGRAGLFAFAPPGAPGQTVLIIDAKPVSTGPRFHPRAVYRISVDNDGDLLADATFTFTFSPPAEGPQVMTAYYATGGQARQRAPVGEVLIAAAPVGVDASAQPVRAGRVSLFAGLRRAPSGRAPSGGAQVGRAPSGGGPSGGANIRCIAIEVPGDMLGPDPRIGLWVTVSLRRESTLDRSGHPDLLRYDRARPARYPNGRDLTGHAVLAGFPYLGPPVR